MAGSSETFRGSPERCSRSLPALPAASPPRRLASSPLACRIPLLHTLFFDAGIAPALHQRARPGRSRLSGQLYIPERVAARDPRPVPQEFS